VCAVCALQPSHAWPHAGSGADTRWTATDAGSAGDNAAGCAAGDLAGCAAGDLAGCAAGDLAGCAAGDLAGCAAGCAVSNEEDCWERRPGRGLAPLVLFGEHAQVCGREQE